MGGGGRVYGVGRAVHLAGGGVKIERPKAASFADLVRET